MYYFDSVEKSGEYLRLALNYMGKHHIPVDPMNYTIWYDYVSGRNKELKAAIDELLRGSTKFTTKITRDLYNRYVSNSSKAAVEEMRQEIKRILAEILKHIMEAGGEVSRYAEVIKTYGDELVDNLNAEEIKNIVDRIINETKNMEESGALLKERLMATTREVEALRKDLEKVRREATTDMLTGLANRRAFEKALAEEISSASKSKKSLSLLMADIDNFKLVNDTYGHLVGDEVLRIIASVIKDSIKGKDLVARYGGEEFVVMLPDTPLAGARALSEKMRLYFETTKIKRKDTGEIIGRVTLSFGVAVYKEGEDPEEFVKRADTALYNSKKKGRNRVTTEMEIS